MKLAERMTTKTRQRYTDVFKAEAVRLVCDSARPVTQITRNLGIADHLLHRWRVEQGQTESQGHTRELLRMEQEGLMRLRRERSGLAAVLSLPIGVDGCET